MSSRQLGAVENFAYKLFYEHKQCWLATSAFFFFKNCKINLDHGRETWSLEGNGGRGGGSKSGRFGFLIVYKSLLKCFNV